MLFSTLVIACCVASVLAGDAHEAKDSKLPWATCVSDSGGTCKYAKCNGDRGGDDKVECVDGKCMCKAGFCALGGVCYDKVPSKDTGGTCKYLNCDSVRNAVCENEKCVCEGDTYATTTYCAKEDDLTGCAKTQYKAGVCRAECQRQTVLTCLTSSWWCGDNSQCARDPKAPWLSSGMITAGFGCKCMEGFCATDGGVCVKTPATPEGTQGFKQPFPQGLVIQGMVWLVVLVLCCFSCKRRCAQRNAAVADEGFQRMGDEKQ